MQSVKGKGNRLERRLWALLAGCHLRGWKKNVEGILGKPDAAFINQRVAVFVDGCFWHGCPHCRRKLPETNREYWETKIKRNVERAQRYNEQLRQDGWVVVRIWEHEMDDTGMVSARIIRALESRGAYDDTI
ncbi:MAG: very short patch repair endonuclease [Chloroflexi bacterium]|nr:very short patch repair endonuclease [Chloroflexota bacterium]